MNRKEFVRRIASVMRENDIRKPVSMPKQVFHISDDEGNKKDFVLRKIDKTVLFTVDDVEAVVDACLYVIGESLKHGESITFRGFGTLGLKYMKPKKLKHVETGEDIISAAHYLPKFSYGNDLRMCAKIYELSLADQGVDMPLPVFNDDGGDE